MILTTGKSEYLYNYIITEVIKIFENTGHKKADFPNKFMMDFESSLIKVIRNNFNNIKVNGRYFHFVKLLWSRAFL